MRPTLIEPDRFEWLDTTGYSFSLGLEAAGAAWLAGNTASRFDPDRGRVVVEGDGAAQASLCWDKVRAVTEASGRSIEGCSEVVEYLTPSGLAQRGAIAAVRPVDRPASTVVVESLVRPEAVVEVEVVVGATPSLVRIPQVLPVDGHGDVVHPDDFVAQCRWVLEEAERRLAGHGLDLHDVVRVVQQTTPATRRAYGDTADARRQLLGPHFPSSTGILVSELPHPRALVALDVWASTAPKQIVSYAADAYAPLTFSPAVISDGLVHISGTTAWNPDTGDTVAPDDIVGQAEFVYDQIRAMCEAAGTSIDRLVKTIEYVTPAGLDRYREVGAVRKRVLAQPYPVSTGVVVAGLLSRRWQIEVEAVAVLP